MPLYRYEQHGLIYLSCPLKEKGQPICRHFLSSTIQTPINPGRMVFKTQPLPNCATLIPRVIYQDQRSSATSFSESLGAALGTLTGTIVLVLIILAVRTAGRRLKQGRHVSSVSSNTVARRRRRTSAAQELGRLNRSPTYPRINNGPVNARQSQTRTTQEHTHTHNREGFVEPGTGTSGATSQENLQQGSGESGRRIIEASIDGPVIANMAAQRSGIGQLEDISPEHLLRMQPDVETSAGPSNSNNRTNEIRQHSQQTQIGETILPPKSQRQDRGKRKAQAALNATHADTSSLARRLTESKYRIHGSEPAPPHPASGIPQLTDLPIVESPQAAFFTPAQPTQPPTIAASSFVQPLQQVSTTATPPAQPTQQPPVVAHPIRPPPSSLPNTGSYPQNTYNSARNAQPPITPPDLNERIPSAEGGRYMPGPKRPPRGFSRDRSMNILSKFHPERDLLGRSDPRQMPTLTETNKEHGLGRGQ